MGVIGSVLNGIRTVGNVVKSVTGLGGSGLAGAIGQGAQMAFESSQAAKQRDWNEAMLDKQNNWSVEQWNRTNEYNSPSAQVQRLQEAGLNPLYYGLDGSSANGLESAQALGYDRASMGSATNPINAALQASQLQKQIELTEAQKNKLESETASTKLDNEFKERTMSARQEGIDLANSLTKENIAKVADERNQISANIGKIVAETENEEERKYLIQAETNVKKMEAKQIVEMLPYQKLLTEAQTENQKAAASLTFANAAIQNGLLDKGYVEAQIAKFDAEINKLDVDTKNAENVAQINEFKQAIRTGNWSSVTNIEASGKVGKAWQKILNATYGSLSAISEAIAGPISGLVK